MNESRPPMTKAEFLSGYVPVGIDLPNGSFVPMAFIKGTVVRWVSDQSEQRIFGVDVIAKDAATWDERIYPHVNKVEVMDMVTKTIYHIDAAKFHENKAVIKMEVGYQYVVRRSLWAQELLTMYPSRD